MDRLTYLTNVLRVTHNIIQNFKPDSVEPWSALVELSDSVADLDNISMHLFHSGGVIDCCYTLGQRITDHRARRYTDKAAILTFHSTALYHLLREADVNTLFDHMSHHKWISSCHPSFEMLIGRFVQMKGAELDLAITKCSLQQQQPWIWLKEVLVTRRNHRLVMGELLSEPAASVFPGGASYREGRKRSAEGALKTHLDGIKKIKRESEMMELVTLAKELTIHRLPTVQHEAYRYVMDYISQL